jgi:uncharacterized protein with PQ loop repeat
MSVAVKVLQYLGNISALIYFSTPLFQVLKQKLYKDIDTIKNVSLALIITILFNCLFWVLNALSSNDLGEWIPLLISNIGGLLINIILLFWYLYVLLEHKKKQFLGYGFFVVNLLLEIGYLIYRYIIKDSSEDSFHIIGYFATVVNILMYSSPFFNYKTIINTKNSGAIPLYTIISGIFTCLLFFIQGFVSFRTIKDNMRDRQSNIETMISNTISFILLGILSALYGFHYTKKEIKIDEHNEDLGINEDTMNENINEGIA